MFFRPLTFLGVFILLKCFKGQYIVTTDCVNNVRMPRKCCVPGCRGNYDKSESISVFSFPNDTDRRRLWVSKIPRADFEPTRQSVVCAKHFSSKFVLTTNSATRPDGSVLTIERLIPKLTDDAFPSIFPNCPSYLSVEPPAKRKTPEDRRAEVQQRDDQSFTNYLDEDKIVNFQVFSTKFQDQVKSNLSLWMFRLHHTKSTSTISSSERTGQSAAYWSFYRIIDCSDTSKPTLVSTIRVFDDLHVEVFTNRIGKYYVHV